MQVNNCWNMVDLYVQVTYTFTISLIYELKIFNPEYKRIFQISKTVHNTDAENSTVLVSETYKTFIRIYKKLQIWKLSNTIIL